MAVILERETFRQKIYICVFLKRLLVLKGVRDESRESGWFLGTRSPKASTECCVT